MLCFDIGMEKIEEQAVSNYDLFHVYLLFIMWQQLTWGWGCPAFLGGTVELELVIMSEINVYN